MAGRSWMSKVGAVFALAVVLGAVLGLAWALGAVRPSFAVQSGGRATITELGLTQIFSSDWTFSLLGVLGGLILGAVSWITLRRIGWPVAVVATAAATLAGVTCWLVGPLIGPGNFAARLAVAEAGDIVPISLELRAPSALAIWAFAAVAVPLFAAALGPEVDGGDERPNRRRRRAEPVDEADPDDLAVDPVG